MADESHDELVTVTEEEETVDQVTTENTTEQVDLPPVDAVDVDAEPSASTAEETTENKDEPPTGENAEEQTKSVDNAEKDDVNDPLQAVKNPDEKVEVEGDGEKNSETQAEEVETNEEKKENAEESLDAVPPGEDSNKENDNKLETEESREGEEVKESNEPVDGAESNDQKVSQENQEENQTQPENEEDKKEDKEEEASETQPISDEAGQAIAEENVPEKTDREEEEAGVEVTSHINLQPDGIPEEDEPEAETDRQEMVSPAAEDQEGLGEIVPEEHRDDYDEEEDEYEEEEVEEEEFDRDALIQHYKDAVSTREQKKQQNLVLQTKLSEYFRKKKADQGQQEPTEAEKSVTDQEQRYVKFLNNLDEMRKERNMRKDAYEDRIDQMEEECQRREEIVKDLYQNLLDLKKTVGMKSVSVTNGRAFPQITQRKAGDANKKGHDLLTTSVDDMLAEEAEIENQVIRVRLENISLLNKMKKGEMTLKSKDELSEGLHMIDFEQLKIENQTYNEKIEERQEELLKLKKKITNNVQILTHLKEKLEFVQSRKRMQQDKLEELDKTLAKRRDQLTRTKQARDALRNDNQKLKQNSGLLGNEALLRNFEENVDLVSDKKKRLDRLKMEHAEVTLQCNKLKRKIDQVRSTSAAT